MQPFSATPRTVRVAYALMALAAVTLIAGCGGGPIAAPIAPTPTSVITAPTAPAATPTNPPQAPASTAALAQTATPQAPAPTVAGSVSAKATTTPPAPSPTAPQPTTKAGAGGTHSACDVITKSDVETVLGVPVLAPPGGAPSAGMPPGSVSTPDDGTTICIYTEQGGGHAGVMITLAQPNPNDPAGKRPLTQAIKGTALQPLSGIGDEAVTDGRHIVITRKDGWQLAIIGQSATGDASTLDAEKRLAKVGADRL
jgi:hypothetical protein